jgi:L-aspartate oxidase
LWRDLANRGQQPLISEAVRGEGAILLNNKNEQFMVGKHPQADLAPRDVVAIEIFNQMQISGQPHVWLDATKINDFTHRFPTIYASCIKNGIDPTKEMIPVAPASHYASGGVLVDLNGKSSVDGLYICGESACTGAHGANRLASNSLLECFVFGDACARHIDANWDSLPPPPPIRQWDESRVTDSDEEVVIAQCWREIRQFMWNFVGIVRTTKRLERAQHRIDLLRSEVEDYYSHFRVTPDLIELRNLVEVAALIIRSALARHESRGLHFTLDYPKMADEAVDTILMP